MGIINVNIDKIYGRASQAEVDALKGEIEAANRMLYDGSGKGGDFLGWVSLPGRIGSEELEAVEACARSLASLADVIVVIGIGGSYLGTKAVYEAMNDSFQLLRKKQDRPLLLFAGQNLSEDYLSELLAAVKPYRIAAIVISKSGTTTEPAVAFRLIKEEIESRYGKAEASKRIVAVTDAKRGALRTLATQEGYATFVIPDNVGGRYSVLTPVGLLPPASGSASWSAARRIWRRPPERTCPSSGIRRLFTLPRGRRSIARAARSRFWAATIRSCFMWPSGGSSSTERAKARRAKEFSRPA